MQKHVQKWGNSLGVRLPASATKHLRLQPGSVVEIVAKNDHISIYPHKYNLDEMLELISDANLHPVSLDDEESV